MGRSRAHFRKVGQNLARTELERRGSRLNLAASASVASAKDIEKIEDAVPVLSCKAPSALQDSGARRRRGVPRLLLPEREAGDVVRIQSRPAAVRPSAA